MRQIHLCDPQLQGLGGHYLTHDAQLIRELQRRSLSVNLYSRRGCTVVCEGVTSQPTFSHDIFQEAATDAQVWAIENFQAINQAFLADLVQIPTERFSSDDLVYFPNLLQNQLYAVAQWVSRLPAANRPVVAVMLRYLNHAMDYVQARPNKEMIAHFYRFAARALFAAQPKSVLCADTRELAMAYQKITGLPVLELPNPMDVSTLLDPVGTPLRGVRGQLGELPLPASNPDSRPTVVYQGHTSALRGLHFLPEIIERCAKLQPKPRFIVQVQNRQAATAQLGPTIQRLDALAAAGDDVRLVEGALESDAYYALLREADVILLPYSPTFYGHGSSGVFTEAASLGKVIVVSPNTVPARQGREYNLGVITAVQWTPAAMAEGVATALRNLSALQLKASTAAPRFRAEQCAQALWEKLLSALSSQPLIAKPN